jgi:ribonuclease HII
MAISIPKLPDIVIYMQKWVIGIDEAGRGPLAGPVSVGVVLIPVDFDWDLIPGVNDSKQLSEKKREVIYAKALELAAVGKLVCSVEMMPAAFIDKQGIVPCIKEAIEKGLLSVITNTPINWSSNLAPRLNLGKNSSDRHMGKSSRRDLELGWDQVMVKLDGSLRAPEYCVHQETIIKGDAKEKVIGLASILAKVTRDHYMLKLSDKPVYKKYHFARHKGYGTAAHRAAIAAHGLSPEHRRTFCRNIKGVV